jgi:hypothetical protein
MRSVIWRSHRADARTDVSGNAARIDVVLFVPAGLRFSLHPVKRGRVPPAERIDVYGWSPDLA